MYKRQLLRPTKIYVKPVLAAMDVADVHGVSHITGGGFYENIPRCIPDGLCAKIDKSALRTPPIFSMLQRKMCIRDRRGHEAAHRAADEQARLRRHRLRCHVRQRHHLLRCV